MWILTPHTHHLHKYLSSVCSFYLLLVNLMSPLNVSVPLISTQIAPPLFAELLMKLLDPMRLSTALLDTKIAPPLSAELLMKLVVPLMLYIHTVACCKNCTIKGKQRKIKREKGRGVERKGREEQIEGEENGQQNKFLLI